jgi:3-oxoacyl-ACP reductase-like protein
MGLFNNLMSKIFGHATAATATAPGAQTQSATAPEQQAQAQAPAAPAAAVAPPPVVDVTAILNDLAKKNPEKLDWKRSIVDLMKLVGMDSSFAARKQLAEELHYTGDPNDSASMNIWLHKEVLRKLAENGGKVPQELLS